MHSMHFHCLAASSAVFLLTRFRGIKDRTWCKLGGAPAELAKLHLAAAGFQGCAEGPLPPALGHASCYLQGNAFHSMGLWFGDKRCGVTPGFTSQSVSHPAVSTSRPRVYQTIFMVMEATAVCRPTLLDSIPQPRADPWVYRTIFHARRAHRQNLLCPVTSLFPVVG